MRDFEFHFGSEPVGVFCGGWPTTTGRFEYDPYRGEGHARFAETLLSGRPAPCWYKRGLFGRVHFDVTQEEFLVGEPGQPSHWFITISRLDA
ncbi:MAG TPA: hypothetical protein VHB77_23000 [Planctomycetaceae bacterium]|nr:hypothetical protein [Planctomycetaceae bacterium]